MFRLLYLISFRLCCGFAANTVPLFSGSGDEQIFMETTNRFWESKTGREIVNQLFYFSLRRLSVYTYCPAINQVFLDRRLC